MNSLISRTWIMSIKPNTRKAKINRLNPLLRYGIWQPVRIKPI